MEQFLTTWKQAWNWSPRINHAPRSVSQSTQHAKNVCKKILWHTIGYQSLKFRDDGGGLENWPCPQCYSFCHLYFTFQAELTWVFLRQNCFPQTWTFATISGRAVVYLPRLRSTADWKQKRGGRRRKSEKEIRNSKTIRGWDLFIGVVILKEDNDVKRNIVNFIQLVWQK